MPKTEKYVDRELSVVTKRLFVKCHEVWRLLNTTLEKEKYKHEFMTEEDLAFKMIRNNVTQVLHQLDWVRKHRRKFICINDDLDHDREDSKIVRKVLQDFYESFFPLPSQFELRPTVRNRFLYKKDLDDWKRRSRAHQHEWNVYIPLLFIMLVFVLLFKKLKLFCRTCFRKFFERARTRFDIWNY